MFLLHKFQEGRHVGSTKVINRPESSEYALLRQPLEVILANVLQAENRQLGNQREREKLDL